MGFQHKLWLDKWQRGKVDGNIGIHVRNFSGHLKIYLRKKFNNECSICGWNKKHPITGIVPIEIDHIDGDSENNK
jgi:hypothetical protein